LEHDDAVEARYHHSSSKLEDDWIRDVRCVEIVVIEKDLQGFVLGGEESKFDEARAVREGQSNWSVAAT